MWYIKWTFDDRVRVLFTQTETLKGNTNGLWENESVREGDGGPSPNSLQPSFLAFRHGSNWRLFSGGQSIYTQSFKTKLYKHLATVGHLSTWHLFWFISLHDLYFILMSKVSKYYYIACNSGQLKSGQKSYTQTMFKEGLTIPCLTVLKSFIALFVCLILCEFVFFFLECTKMTRKNWWGWCEVKFPWSLMT